MNQNRILAYVVSFAGLILAMVVINATVQSSTGGIAAAILYLGIALAVVAFIKPKFGIYIVVAEAFTTDFIKKLAVYYGTASESTIVEVMVVVMLAVCATIAGTLLEAFVFRKFKIGRLGWLFLSSGLSLSAVVLTLSLIKDPDNLLEGLQLAFNLGAYLGLGIAFVSYFHGRADLLRLFNLQLILATMSAAWALWQVYAGWASFEVFYASTGLSQIASIQYYTSIAWGGDPRPCGFASGTMNFAYIAGLCAYGVYRIINIRHWRILSIFATAILYAAIFASQLKTGILLALVAPICAVLFNYRKITITGYLVGFVSFVWVVLNATMLRDNIAKIDDSLRGIFGIPPTYSIQTFEARLHSFTNFTDPRSWSVLGLSPEQIKSIGTHDVFSSILIYTGAVGLTVTVVLLFLLLVFAHRSCRKISSGADRKLYLALLGYTIPAIAFNFIGGSNLHSLPINLVISSCIFGLAVLVLNRQDAVPKRQEPQPSDESLRSDLSGNLAAP